MNTIVVMTELTHAARDLQEAGRELQDVIVRLRRLAEAEELRGLAAAGLGEISAAHIRSVIAGRRLWRESIGVADGDPAWALLMELFARRLEGRPVTVNALGEAAGLAPTTSLRWIGRLHSHGLIARQPHPKDERPILVSLTDEAEDRLRGYFMGALRLSPWVL